MDQNQINAELSLKAENIVEKLREELLSIRTGKPNPGLVEDLVITVYNGSTKLRLKELASIASDPPQSLLIVPFDPSIISDIEKGILTSELHVSPITQGTTIRVQFPPLTEDQRKQMVRVVSQKVEEFKGDLRNLRDDMRKKIKLLLDNKELSEDEKFSYFELIEKIIKEFNETIDSIKDKKHEELMTV